MDSITMSTRARVHTYTRFEIETSSPSNQIYARLVFRARRIWTEHASKQRASASHLSLVERGATFPFFQKNRNNSAGFFQPLIPYTFSRSPFFLTILIRARHRSLLATFSPAHV